MNKRLKFFNKKNDFLTVAKILEITGGKILQEADLSKKVYDVATLENAGKNQISFLNSAQYFQKMLQSKAEFCLIDEINAQKTQKSSAIYIICKNPYYSYSQIVDAFYEEKQLQHSLSNTHPSAKIGEGTIIAPSAYVGSDVIIGKNCIIAPNSCILDGCEIGDNTIINSGAVVSFAEIGKNCKIYSGAKIGQDGFGFAHNQGINHKIIQIGMVKIADNVEIGANSCVDRGAIEDTEIGEGTKIDNLVQIGHNVKIGKGTVIAGCAAVAGSAKIGNFVQIGGKASISGHITLNDGAKIAGMSGVIRDVAPMEAVAGIPAVPIRSWHKINAMLLKMLKKQ
jgi:UDP-3-O-[3-hydroxymyristoyl] glucosamine N-acyltransferase